MPESKASPIPSADIVESAELCARELRLQDPERYIASLFATPEKRIALWGLYGFNLELARVREIITEPMIGQIRFQWWREAVEEIVAGESVRRHQVVQPLEFAITAFDLNKDRFEKIIEARQFDVDESPPVNLDALELYAESVSGLLFELAADVLTGDKENRLPARSLGTCWGLVGQLRSAEYFLSSGKSFIPALQANSTAARNPFQEAARPIGEIIGTAKNLVEIPDGGFRRDKRLRPLTALLPLLRRDLNMLAAQIGQPGFPKPGLRLGRQARIMIGGYL